MYYLFIFGNFLASILPRRLCYFLARVFALVHLRLSQKDREALEYNLGPVVADTATRSRYIREICINFSYYLVDFFRYPKVDHDFIKKYVQVRGLENVQWVYSQGRPAIALTAHLGNYELAGVVTSLLKYPVAAVALPHKSKRVNDFFDSRRRMFGMSVIPTGRAFRGCIKALESGQMLALLGDRDFSGSGLSMRMFSRRALLPRGPAFFALKTGACIIPAFLVRRDKYYYRLAFEEPIDWKKENLNTEEKILERYVSVLERYIRKYPQQWYLFEKYWLPQGVESKE
jgi:KDO2-lipid IV(A) lauroyltransferase